MRDAPRQNGARDEWPRGGALWRGIWEDAHDSQSEADLALCNHLAFWCGRNPARMDHLFRQSGLYRPKWDERHFGDGRTYGEVAIAKACAACTDVFTRLPPKEARSQQSRRRPRPRTRRPPWSPPTRYRRETAQYATLFVDGDAFLSVVYPPVDIYIDGLLSDEGGGWLAGEEKLFKTFYALHEAACLVLGKPVLGRFAVPTARTICFIEEEDSARRTQRRLRTILAGLDVKPDDPAIREILRARFHLAVWNKIRFDDPAMVTRLDAELDRYHPAVATSMSCAR